MVAYCWHLSPFHPSQAMATLTNAQTFGNGVGLATNVENWSRESRGSSVGTLTVTEEIGCHVRRHGMANATPPIQMMTSMYTSLKMMMALSGSNREMRIIFSADKMQTTW